MPTWGEILKELVELQQAARARAERGEQPKPGDPSPFDDVRRTYLKALSQLTGRATIVYATSWLEDRPPLSQEALTVHLGDMQGFMEAVSNVSERELDLFLLSPGGSAEAAESIVEYLRTRFDHIRAVIPLAAMSAATMIALSCDEIIMGTHSQLGPIDPQFTIVTPEGPRSAPAQAILDTWATAQDDLATNPKKMAAWLPIIRSYAPGLIAQCVHARELSESYVEGWLRRFMFKDDPKRDERAASVAKWFSAYEHFRSHGRRVSRDEAKKQGLRVVDLEADQGLQDAVLSVHHACQHTLSGTGTNKIIENHHGRAWIKAAQMISVPMPGPPEVPQDRGTPARKKKR